MFQYFELLLGFLGALFAAYEGYLRYLDEKQFNYYKDTIKNLFSSNKEEVMAAIATLGVYTNRRKYKKSTIDTLINILYTELDYDVSNAIIGVLIQSGKKEEVKYISSRVIEINRNFFIQTAPLSNREKDIKERIKEIQGSGDAPAPKDEKTDELQKNEVTIQKQLRKLEATNKFELKWHKNVTADVLSMILNKAFKVGLTSGLDLEFYQNDFNYCYLAGFNLDNFSIRHSAISSGNIMDLKFSNMKQIYNSTFAYSYISDCHFSGGKISGSSFCGCSFNNVLFENVKFVDSFFFKASFNNCEFRNATGLTPEQFFGVSFLSFTNFNGALDIDDIKKFSIDQVISYLEKAPIPDETFKEVTEYLKT
jgi:uncharacterized protein YjbI with pentapeptide repeats